MTIVVATTVTDPAHRVGGRGILPVRYHESRRTGRAVGATGAAKGPANTQLRRCAGLRREHPGIRPTIQDAATADTSRLPTRAF